jgi:protein-S-isoprenylcysteine O-methyltransferase Ste14
MAEIEKRAVSWATMLKAFVGLTIAAMVIVFAGFVLMHAHRLDWKLGGIYVGIVIAAWMINLVFLRLLNPELIGRRVFGKWDRTWDKVWAALFVLAIISIFVVADKDTRDGVSSAPGAAWLLGYAIFVLGWTLFTWSMVVNPFFEKAVRIQTNHGHRVIDKGPYAYVRHPGYMGFVGWLFSTPLLLASAWAFVPTLIAVVLLVIRAALEDRMLHAELTGYTEYAARVRFRLIPGVW